MIKGTNMQSSLFSPFTLEYCITHIWLLLQQGISS